MIENIVLTKQINNITTKRDINDQSILEYQLLLIHENWEENLWRMMPTLLSINV